jgi:hypothetical protein
MSKAYKRLRDAMEALGGTLEYRKSGGPPGGTWELKLGDKQLSFPSEQSKRFRALDACYRLKPGVAVSRTWEDHTNDTDPAGLADLFKRLAASQAG